MRNAVRAVTCALSFGVVSFVASGQTLPESAQPVPPQALPEAQLTERKVYDLWQEHEYQAMIGPYKKSAFTDPKWDRKVDELYRIAAKNFSSRAAQSPRQIELLTHLQNAGCKDPLVRSMIITSKLQSNPSKSKIARAIEDSEECLAGLVETGYGKIRQWRLTVNILALKKSLGEDRSQLANWMNCSENELVAAASEPNLSPVAERLIYEKFRSDMEGSTTVYSREICDKINASNASVWLKGCITGYFHVKEAWNRRGDGWASEVNDAGWKGFASELSLAHECFNAAYKSDPSRPEPASEMICVVAASHDFPNESESMWFDRATKAQFDYAEAYVTRRWFLRPRWGGSHEEMLKLASSWVDTGRFDTRVPEMYLWTLDDICADRSEYETIWQEPEVLARVEQLKEGYLAQKDPYFNTILSRIAHILWLGGRRAEAKDLVDQLQDGFVPTAGSVVCLSASEFSAVHAYAPQVRAAALAADSAAETNDFDKSIASLVEAKAEHADLPEPVAKALDRQIALFRFRKSLNGHQWTSLILSDSPESFFDDGAIPEAWVINADSIRLTARNSWWGEFRFLPKVGTRYELRSRITVPADGQSDKCSAGFILYFSTHCKYPFWQTTLAAPLRKTWTSAAGWMRNDPKPMEADNPLDLHVKVWDEEIVIKIDGAVVYAGPAARPDRNVPLRDQVGLCAVDRDPASGPIEFKDPSIRLLQSRPSELGIEEAPARRPRRIDDTKPRF